MSLRIKSTIDNTYLYIFLKVILTSTYIKMLCCRQKYVFYSPLNERAGLIQIYDKTDINYFALIYIFLIFPLYHYT